MNKKGQATVEYIILVAVIAIIFSKILGEVQWIFYGEGAIPGAIELFIQTQVVGKLSNYSGW
jgi:hypothetical protein